MSLINDALKRAKQAQQKGAVPLPVTAPTSALRAAEPAYRQEPGTGIVLPLALVVLMAAIGLIIWLVMSARVPSRSPTTIVRARPAPATAASRVNAQPQPKAMPIAPAAPPTAVAVEPSASPATKVVDSTVALNASAANVAAAATTVETQSPPGQSGTLSTLSAPATVGSGPPPPPALPKLQGVFYRPQRPAALVNGKMVLIGSTVGEHRVLAIGERTVTIARAGQTNVLEMPE